MTAFDTILDALDRAGMTVKGSAPKVRAQCPHHGSQGLSLSVRQFSDRAKVHCFAGCETEDVLTAIGLQLRDLYDEPARSGYRPPAARAATRRTPWEEACAGITVVVNGRETHPLQNPPPIEHLLDRMVVEQAKERGEVAP
jgi:hypothetical protein